MPTSAHDVEIGRVSLPRESNDLYRIAWHHKKLILIGAVLGVVLGVTVALLLAPVYQSTAQILMVKKRPDAVTGVDTRSMGGEEYIAPAQELLKSHLIIERAIQAKKLDRLAMFAHTDGSLIESIRGGLTVTPVKSPLATSTNVFSLAYRGVGASRLSSPDATGEDTAAERECQVVLEAILDTFKDFLDKKYQNVSTDTIELIIREKESLAREMEDKAAAYRKFREESPLLGKDGLDLRRETLTGIQMKRSALLLRRVEFEAQLSAARTALQSGQSRAAVLAMLTDFAIKAEAAESGTKGTSPQEQLYPLMLEERRLLDAHGAKHPEVLAVRGRIEQARRLLSLPATAWGLVPQASFNENRVVAASTNTVVDPAPTDPVEMHMQLLKQKCEQIKASEELLAKVLRTEQDEARRLATFEIQDESLRTNVALTKAMYEALVKRLSDVSLLRNVGGYEIETMEPPALGKKVGPSSKMYAIAGALAGLLLAYGAACLVEVFKSKP